jgi:4-amino-4-deoxy-L-arabinose transferase-like glycosyltransferase
LASLSPRASSEPLPAATLWLAAASALVLALLVAPRVFHNYDVVDCFLTWARASRGRQPWAIYLTHFATDDCDYPPVVPYLLTLVERARLAVGAGETSGTAIVLLKLPNIVAWLAHVPLCAIGLRRPFGARAASVAALLVALSPPLFVNAAAWGQFDALLSLFVVAALVALLRGQAGRAGAALGLALATKLLAVVAIPVLALWAWRRRGARPILAGGAAALLVMALAAMPYVARGAARPVLSSYHGAVGYYPLRTVEAYNLWYVLDRVDIRLRGQPSGEARLDTRPFVGPLTHRDVGLLLVAAWTVFILAGLWRWPGDGGLALAAAFQFFAVFMLPTQMHQRYILPAAVLLALVAPLSPRARTLFAVLAVTATLNQGLDLGRAVLDHAVQVDPSRIGDAPALRMAIRNVATGVALVHVGLLAWWTAVYRRELAALAALTPAQAAGSGAASRPE